MAKASAAIYYEPKSFTLARSDLKGRHSASAGFMGGVARHVAEDPVHCYTVSAAAAQHCADLLRQQAGRPRPVRWVRLGDLDGLAAAGCLFVPDPQLASQAWMRRSGDQRAFSICGVTHTICSAAVLSAIGDYLLAPLQPWDALICTSQAARAAILGHLERYADYLAERTGGRPALPLRLPVIPLGVDCRRFAEGDRAAALRAGFRGRLGIAEDDMAMLFFGRLSFHAKAHPLAMVAAVEAAARRLGRRFHFLFVGQYPNDQLIKDFRAVAGAAPSVAVHFLDGSDDALAEACWHGADLFLSLSDNIQETFGLTPIEAMAAGLPAIVSDWDGYRDTVVDGETGFRVATAVPPAGTGEELAMAYAAQQISYDRFIGGASMATAVDVAACTEAIIRLAEDAELRRRMSAAARRRAREHYDWSVVIGQYQELWGELAAIRRSAAAETTPRRPGTPANPLCDDPFRVFGNFASEVLTDDAAVTVDDTCRPLAEALSLEINTYMLAHFLPAADLARLVERLRGRPQTLAGLAHGHAQPQRVRMAVMWMLKLAVAKRC